RYFVTTDSSGDGTLGFQRRDGGSGLPRGPFATFSKCGVTNGVMGLIVAGRVAYAAATATAPSLNAVVGIKLFDANDSLVIESAPDWIVKDGQQVQDPFNQQDPYAKVTVVGLQGVTHIAITPPTTDIRNPPRLSLYALAPGEHALTAFNVTQDDRQLDRADIGPPLHYSQTLMDPATCAPSATVTCIGPMVDARNLVVSPDGSNVYV